MPKYRIKNITNPVNVSEQEVEDFLQKYPDAVLIEEEQIEEEVDFLTSTVEDADAVQQPMTASQAEYVEPKDTDLPSVDTSLESLDPEPRFIEFKGKGNRPGAIVYEDTYLETKAGQPGYPDTFDEYAAAFNTTPQSSSTEEIVIKATPNEKVFESLASTPLGIDLNKKTNSFDLNPGNTKIYNQEEEAARPTLNRLFEGSKVDFVETDIVQEGDVNAVLGSEALRARIKNPETGEYIYSEILELESDGSFMNNDKIEKFLDENKSYLDLPKWTRSKNKMIAKYKQWKNSELDPIINKARVEAEQAYIVNPDLFKPYDKKIFVGGFNTSTTVTETINPYQKEIAEEVNRLERKGVKKNLEAQAKINVRRNLKQADINEAIRETRAKFINASSNKEEAQAFLYASETFVKNEEAKAYNENNESSQISAEGANKNQKQQQIVINASRATPSKNQSDDDFILQQQLTLQPIIDELNIEMPENPNERINSPKLNMLLGLDEEVMLPKGLVNIMMALEDAKNANISDYNDKRIKMAESIGNISDIDVAMEATAKNYELVEKWAVNAGLGLQDIAVNVGMLGLNILSLGQSEKVAKLGSDYVEYTKEIRDSYQRDVSFDEAFSSPGNTGKFVMQEVSNQLPIFLAMAASGGSAAYVIGASSAGGKMMDMQNEIATGTAEYSPIKLWGTTFGYGVTEGLFAQLTTVPILRRAKLNWMNGGKESVVNNSMREYAKKQYTGLIYEPILEAAGEVATVGSQNLMDGNPFMQGMDHAGTSGLGFGFAFAAIPFLKGMYNSQFSTYETRGEIRKMQNELDGLQQELNMSLLNTPSSGINIFKGKQDLLKQSIEEKSIQLADKIKQQEVIVANNLTEGAKNEVVKIINRQAELENKAIEIQKNPNISNKERAALIAEIKADYDIVVKARNEAVKDETMLKNGTEWAAFKGLNRVKSQEYLDTADAMLSGERNGKQASKEDINDRAYDLYFADKIIVENKKLGRINSNLFKNFKSLDTVDEAIIEVNNDDTIAPKDKQKIILNLKKGSDGYWNPASGTMVAIVENQVKNQRKYTKTHEVGHKAFEMLLGNPENNAAFKAISDQLLSTLKATDRKTYNKFIKDGIDDDAGNIDPTEVISRFMEYVADDKITNVQKAKGISGLFGVMIQKTFDSDYKFDFRGEQDIFNFVVGFGKKLKDGTLTTADIKKAKESKVIKDLPTSDTTDTDRKISFSKQLTSEQDTQLRSDVAEIKKEASKGEALAKEFNKDFIKGAKQTRLENKVLQEIKPVVDRVVTNRTKALYDPIAEDAKKNVSRQMFQESMRSDIESMVFDEFTGKQDLEKFIVNRAFLRANNLAERLGIKSVEEGITKGLEAAEKVAVEETKAPKAEKPKYRNILKSNVLPTETINTVKDKVLKTVRTLKSKLDTKVSINKTVTPLVGEIKKVMGKQADIDFKKAMGGKKDGQLRRFLIKNKKAILENMTTTWLMGAMPGAVQKQVNGSFTSDWQGKKIDREKTSTQQAGRTSGAEIVRRLPNAFKNLDDKTYLSYIIDESGAPIRGRKESLAKAMAEELSFDIFTAELQNENSDIRKAFEGNQEALGVVLADNFVNQVTKDVERGTVKFSKAALPYVGKLVKLGIKNGIDEVVDIDGNILVNISGIENIDTTGLGNVVRKAFDIGLVPDGKELRFLQSIQASKIIPQNIKDQVKRAITSKSELSIRKALATDMVKVANTLGSDVTDIIGFDGLGFFNRLLDSAKTKKDKITGEIIPGAKGEFFDFLVNLKKKQPKSSGLPNNYNADEVSPMNSKTGVMGKISRILNKDITAKQKMKEYEKFIPEIEAANVQNKILAKYIITKLVNLVQDGSISPKSFISILQAQTNATAGLRSLTGLKYITFKDGPQGNMKGEHLADNGTSMFEIAELGFENNTKKELSFKIDGILEFHDQWLENREILDFVDQFGKNNPNKDLRIRLLANKDQAFVYTYDLRPAKDLIAERESAIKSRNILEKSINFKELNTVETGQQAINNGNSIKFSKSPKKIRVFDFDDTLARTKSNVLYTMPDGSKGKIDAATFAEDAGKMEDEGAVFDFSEFSKVMDGKKGPLFEVAKKIADARGTEDVFVLTARPQDAAGPIQEFLKSLGLSIPIKNITGLADGNPKAKADWMIGKVAEGYNDFYFADDAIKNVKAVKDVFDTFDIKGKVQQAKIKFSKSLDKDFNEMIERNKGVAAVKEFSRIVAKRRGASIGKFKLWMPSSLDDFKGLTSYVFAGKGRQGDADQKFFQDALITPYFRGIDAIEKTRQTFKDDFKALNKTFKPVVSKLGKIIPDSDYTYDQAIRVALWTKAGYEIPGLSQRDQKKLNDFVNNDPELSAYIDGLTLISKRDKWSKPGSFWDTETILSDLNNLTEKVGRKEFLEEFIENSEIIFSEKNLNKIEAVYGTRQREALEDILYRMKNGTNRSFGMNKNENRWNNWVNNSIGAIMFFNRRSALLQTLSTVNFINWSDNNPAKAALAFANQSQYWKDFAMIFNSPKLKQRRAGLKSDVNEAEIASAVKGAKNKASAALSYLLKIGFTPTQMVDSFAIAAGGATFYRNRVNTLKKKGMSQADAETQAFQDFAQISEETQQSGDPALISSDQASSLGRLVLAFQNTPIQLNRSIKKAALDLYNRRRTPGQTQLQSDFSNISKIIYYGTIQNILFTSLQNALFALLPGFDDEEPTEEERQELETTKASRIINGMVDTTLKGGFGLPGAVVSTIKNVIQEYYKQEEKGFTADQTYTIIQAINLSPPIGSKARKLYSAIQTQKFEADVIKKRGFDVTIDGKFNLSPSFKVLGSAAAAATNLPLDRVVDEVNSLTEALDTRNTQMQRIALALGWKTWDVGSENEENDLIKTTAKAKRKEEGRRKAKETRAKNKRAKRKPTYIKK